MQRNIFEEADQYIVTLDQLAEVFSVYEPVLPQPAARRPVTQASNSRPYEQSEQWLGRVFRESFQVEL